MIYVMKVRVAVPGDQEATDNNRFVAQSLVAKCGGKIRGKNPRAYVVGIFSDKASAKKFRELVRKERIVSRRGSG